MSESSKMGLFGSKDETKDLKKEATGKEESPDRYAPYCIDSDSETYDTEALSIMDINDIIGVHSEPVGDSTLESEIAALSQIITESKTEPTRSITDAMSHIQDEKQIETNRSHESDSLEFSESVDAKSVDTQINSNKLQELGKKSIDNNRLEVVGLNRGGNIHSSSSMSIGESCNKYAITDGMLQVVRSSNKESSNSDISNRSTSHFNSTTPTITNAGGISQSLQLIGEAYISEDSQESTSNDNETKDDVASSYVFKIEHEVEPTESKEMCSPDKSAAGSTQGAEHVTAAEETGRAIEIESDIIRRATVLDVAQPAKNNEDAKSVKQICLDADKEGNTNYSTQLVNSDVETIREETCKADSDVVIAEETCDGDSGVVIAEEICKAGGGVVITDKTCEADSDVVITEETCEADSDVAITDKICKADSDVAIANNTCKGDSDVAITDNTCEADNDVVITEKTCEADNDVVVAEETCEDDNDVVVAKETCEDDSGDVVITKQTCEADSDVAITEHSCEADKDVVITEGASAIEDEDRVESVENSKEDVKESVNEVVNKELAVQSEEVQNVENEISAEDSSNTATALITASESEAKTDVTNDKSTPITTEKTNVKVIEGSEKIKDNANALSPYPEVHTMSEFIDDDSIHVEGCESSRDEADTECDNSNICIPIEEEESQICHETPLEGTTTDGDKYNTEESDKQSVPDIANKVEKPVTKETSTVTVSDAATIIEDADMEVVAENKISKSIDMQETMRVPMKEESSTESVSTILIAATESADKSNGARIEPQTDIQFTVGGSREKEIIIKTDSKIQISETIADTVSIISDGTEQGTEEETLGERNVVDDIGETASAAPPASDGKSKKMSVTQEPDEVSQDSGFPTHSTPVLNETDCLSSDTNNIKTIECEERRMVENAFETGKEKASDTSLKESQDTDDISHNQFKEQVDEERKSKISDEVFTREESETTESFIPADALSENIRDDTTAVDKTIAGTRSAEDVESGTLSEISGSNVIEEGKAEKTAEKSTTIEKQVAITSDAVNIEQEIADDDEEETEEEASCEEMSLTLEPDESELPGTVESDSRIAERVTMTVKSAFEQTDGSTGSAEKEIDSLSIDVNEKTIDIPKPVFPEEPAGGNLTEISCSREPEVSDEVIQGIAEKQDIEESLRPDVDDGGLNSVLENAPNVGEMFAEEQCQNTQDIMTSILENDVTDFKNILEAENSVENDIDDVLQHSGELPNLVEGEIEELAKKLPGVSDGILNKDIEEAAQNMDSLEGLLGLDLMPESEESVEKEKTEDNCVEQAENIEKDVDMSLLLDANRESVIEQDTDYITDVISSCLTNDDGENLPGNEEKLSADAKIVCKETEGESTDILKIGGSIIDETIDKNAESINMESELVVGELQGADLDMDFEENPLESVEGLEEEQKLELSQDILLGSANHSEDLNDPATGIETSQPGSEISELESAVKFLQESEEQAIDSPLVLSPKLVEGVVDDMSKQSDAALFVPDEDICEDTSELVAELQGIATDSISISEAEIISEAAKLENERKLAEQAKLTPTVAEFPNSVGDMKLNTDEILSESGALIEAADNINSIVEEIPSEILTELPTESPFHMTVDSLSDVSATLPIGVSSEKAELPTRCQQEERVNLAKMADIAPKTSESLPKTSILEERLKEPPKIEIPVPEVSKMCSSPTTPKDSLLIQKDAKMSAYQKMLESPNKHGEKGETKITDTPRKDSEKHDFENVGSPRIILKIVKSAIADCGEPRSPKSPKIRSATNSPNPEDSPGQKLGKIKLKLSKGGHPSIISNENVEESGQWHTEGSSSLSPIGMKIKLSKSGDVSIVSSEKHDTSEDLKESKRTESPIGMKIKLSKSGDASIVQQDANITKHKEKLDIMQSSPKRTESPIGMKIKLSKSGDASIIQPDKQESQEEHKEVSGKSKDKLDASCELPKRTESPIGMKIKLSKTGDASIIPSDLSDETREVLKIKEKLESSPEVPKRTESPIGMKIKLAKTKSGASIISVENAEECRERLEAPDAPKRTESPLGMKIKLSKSGDASIIHSEVQEESKEMKHKEKSESPSEGIKQTDVGMKMKVTKPPDTTSTTESSEQYENNPEATQRPESSLGMKIKLSKTGDASIIPSDKMEHEEEQRVKEAHLEIPKRTDSPLGMKIKLSKTGDASIIPSETGEDPNRMVRRTEMEYQKAPDSALGMKIKLVKTADTSIVDVDKKDKQPRRRDVESPLEMKIKLSKTGHPTIVACDNHGDASRKGKEALEAHNFTNRHKDSLLIKEPALKILKAGHSAIMQTNRSELTIEPVQMQSKKLEPSIEISPKRKEITISPIETKKSKLEAQLSQILPEVTIQPVMSRDQKQLLFDPKTSLISRQQMNVISQEISITQVRPPKPGASEVSMSDKLKDILCKNATNSQLGSDCEIIEHRPELIIVNENSNSSQDVVIIEEVPPIRMPETKVPKKRGRPRRNPLPPQLIHQPTQLLIPRDPLALDEMPANTQFEQRENERPKRTCRNQKSYAPPKRGRGRGRGKRKLEAGLDLQGNKKPRVEQDLTAIESSTMAVITLDEHSAEQDVLKKSSELYKALKQPTMDHKIPSPCGRIEKQGLTLVRKGTPQKGEMTKVLEIGPKGILMEPSTIMQLDPNKVAAGSQEYSSKTTVRPVMGVPLEPKSDTLPENEQKPVEKSPADDKVADKSGDSGKQISAEGKDILTPPGHPNWLTPTSKKPADNAARTETMSTVQVIDEETRMSAESGSRSQTPARNIPAPATDQTIVNEESQGSVLSTATTESEKVKVKNRRMEINFDPDEGPFTVDKIAEYEWPLDRKGETFMIQEQISQYLGVKSFKRKYPDLKRRMVDMEERNYLRENGLVSEAMCDMGLTAVCSSEVLDVMCSDFPDQYEEYRKHMREKQVKEHSKKQKELTAAANAEKNRIDLAEMAVQSALSWNVSLNKARKENRKCSLDLQTFTIHVPKKQQKVETDRKHSHYPVALIPGQYTDYYREYTPAELRYYPLNTVLYGPMRPNERKFDSQSEGSQSDSDSDSSSDDSSSSSSEGTQDTEGSQSTMDDVDMEIATQKEEVKLKCKMCLKSLNKHSKSEVLIQCGTCGGNGNVAVHPSCIDLTLDMVPHIQSYAWQCTDCKTCAQCHDPADEDKMLFCDMCDRGYHIYCVGLRRVPQGRWHCQECAVCANCGSREPGGANSDRNSVAQWQHEYKKGDKNTRVYVSTLCVPCSKLWRKGRYCPHCSRCHTAQRPDLEVSLVHCSACDKYLHLGCVETKGAVFDRKNYLCDFCAPAKPSMLKTVKM